MWTSVCAPEGLAVPAGRRNATSTAERTGRRLASRLVRTTEGIALGGSARRRPCFRGAACAFGHGDHEEPACGTAVASRRRRRSVLGYTGAVRMALACTRALARKH